MISRRDKLLNLPWQLQHYEQHRTKVFSAKSTIDDTAPTSYDYIAVKPKKMQTEKDRLKRIEVENTRLLQKLGDIMAKKRLTNFWAQPRPNFLQREKLFDISSRPHSNLPRLLVVYSPPCKRQEELLQVSSKSLGARRCPTCRGTPERTQVLIPEVRIPWEPVHTKRNRKYKY